MLLLPATFRRRVSVVAGTFALVAALSAACPLARAADPTTAPATAEEGLTPCLLAAADGSPVLPRASFPSSKRMAVAFQLKPGETAKQLKAKWYSLGGGGNGGGEKFLTESTADVRTMPSGAIWLEYSKLIPPGRYRVDATLDDRPWKSTEIEITPALPPAAQKPADLVPLTEGVTQTYDIVVRDAPGSKSKVPGGTTAPDGSIRTTLTYTTGKTDADGTAVQARIGDQASEMRMRLDKEGLKVTKRGGGEALEPVDPPQLTTPLPPKLDDGTEWKAKTPEGGEQKLRVFGPLPLKGPAGEAPGYVIFADEQTSYGEPGMPAVRGRQTIERHYIPKVGLVREVRVSVVGGKLSSRQELELRSMTGGTSAPATQPSVASGGGEGYDLVPDPTMKGRLGRVKFEFTKDTDKAGDATVAVIKGEDQRVGGGYGPQTVEAMPGKYFAVINKKRVPIEVKSGHNTIPHSGVLRIHAGAETRYSVHDTDADKTQLVAGYGGGDVILPVGTYTLEIAGASEPVKIERDKVVEF